MNVKDDLESVAGRVADSVEKRGGISGILTDAGDRAQGAIDDIADVALDFYERLEARYNQFEQKFEDTFFTDGVYDPDKAEDILSDKVATTREFGARTAKILIDLAKKGTSDYRELVPTLEERKTVYAGIGQGTDELLLRPDLDKCLAFYEESKSTLPNALKVRRGLLEDIKASGAGNKRQLSSYYRKQGEPGNIMACRKYL
jgi:hypothetical protein